MRDCELCLLPHPAGRWLDRSKNAETWSTYNMKAEYCGMLFPGGTAIYSRTSLASPNAECTYIHRIKMNARAAANNNISGTRYNNGSNIGHVFYVDSTGHLAVANIGYNSIVGSKVLALNVWYTVALVFQSDHRTANLYIDNVPEASGTITGYGSDTGVVCIGNTHMDASANRVWNGYISNTMVYSRALSMAELSWLYAEPYAFVQGSPIERSYSMPTSSFLTRSRAGSRGRLLCN